MALKDYFVKLEKVVIPGHPEGFEVGPLTLVSIMVLLQGRAESFKKLFDDAMKDGLDKEPNTAVIAQWMAKNAPEYLGLLIAHAANEPNMAETASRLPIGVQIDALNKIVNLTFEAEGGVKKFAESVVDLLAKLNLTMEEVNSIQSTDSSKGFIGSVQSS